MRTFGCLKIQLKQTNMPLALHWQTQLLEYIGGLSLPVLAVHTELGRVIFKTLKSMNRILVSGLSNITNNPPRISVAYTAYDESTGVGIDAGTNLTLNSTDSYSDIKTAIINGIISSAAAFYSYTLTTSDDYVWLSPSIFNLDLDYSFSNPSLAVNTSRQASTTRAAMVSASVDITASLSLITGQSGKVELKYADDSAFTTNVKLVQPSTNGNTGTLTIGLALGQTVTAAVSGIIPAGKYYRLVTTNVTGTPTFGTPAIQEVLLK